MLAISSKPYLLVAMIVFGSLLLVPVDVTTSNLSTSSVPKLLFTNGSIVSMDSNTSTFETVLSENGTITEVTNQSISELGDTSVKKVLLDGRALLPGFIDSHSHWIGDRDRVGMTADEVIADALSKGWTTLSELFVNEDRLDELKVLDRDDRLKLRVNAYLPINYQEQRFGTWYQAYSPHSFVSEKVRIGGVKLFMDNGPYFNNINRSHWFNASELNPIVQEAHDLGYQIAIHSFIDNATDTALDALEFAQGDNSDGTSRHRIEHASFLRDDQLNRLNRMNTIVSGQLLWYTSDDAELIYNHTQMDPIEDYHLTIARWRDVINHNITFIGSTDTPWGAPSNMGSSILGLSMVTTRIGENNQTPPDWMLDQRISIEEAVRSITTEAAYGTYEEDSKGSIERGKLADYVVLSENPLELNPQELLNLTVDMTVVGGEIVYCRPGLEDMCDGTFSNVQSTSQTSSMTSSSSMSQSSNSMSSSTVNEDNTTPTLELNYSPTWAMMAILITFVYWRKFTNKKT